MISSIVVSGTIPNDDHEAVSVNSVDYADINDTIEDLFGEYLCKSISKETQSKRTQTELNWIFLGQTLGGFLLSMPVTTSCPIYLSKIFEVSCLQNVCPILGKEQTPIIK